MHCSCCKEILREIFPDIFICWTLILLCPLLGSKVYQTNTRCQHDFLLTTSGFFLLLLFFCCCCCCGFLVFCFVFHGVFWFKISIWLIFFKRNYFYEKQIILTIIQSQQKDQCDENLLPVSEQFFELLLLANLKPIYVNNRNQSYVALIKLCHFSSLSFIKIMADFLYLVYIVQKGAADIYYGV